jgi:hypothetical protein
MKRILAAAGMTIAMMGIHGFAHAGKAHVHGNADMQVVVEGKTIEIELQSPMESLVGFEHAPRNDKQRKAIQAMEERFRSPAALFVPTAEAKCSADPVEVVLPFKSASEHGKHEKHGKDVHSELKATVRFQCENPSALKGMEVKLFEVFSKLHRVDVQTVSSSGQTAARLTPKQHNLQW